MNQVASDTIFRQLISTCGPIPTPSLSPVKRRHSRGRGIRLSSPALRGNGACEARLLNWLAVWVDAGTRSGQLG